MTNLAGRDEAATIPTLPAASTPTEANSGLKPARRSSRSARRRRRWASNNPGRPRKQHCSYRCPARRMNWCTVLIQALRAGESRIGRRSPDDDSRPRAARSCRCRLRHGARWTAAWLAVQPFVLRRSDVRFNLLLAAAVVSSGSRGSLPGERVHYPMKREIRRILASSLSRAVASFSKRTAPARLQPWICCDRSPE